MSTRTPEIQTKTDAKQGLTRAYLRKLSRHNYVATASIALIITLSLFWLLFHLGGDTTVTLFSNTMYAVASFIGAYWACITAYRARYGPLRIELRLQTAWLLVSLGLLSNSLGGIWYTYLEYSGQKNPVPSYSDVGFTLFYILIFAGLLCMPAEPKNTRFRARIGIDVLITALCIFGISWYFVIGPIIVAFLASLPSPTFTDLLQMATVVSYPVWDIVLFLAIVLLIQRRIDKLLYPSLFLFALGILAQIWADTVYAIQIPPNTYSTGTPYIDTFWFIGYLLIGLAPSYQYAAIVRNDFRAETNSTYHHAAYTAPGRTANPQRRLMLLQSLLIYVPLIVLLSITLYSEVAQDKDSSFLLIVVTATVGVLVTIRYVLATQENELLLRERERREAEAEHLRQLTAELTGMLELQRLLEHIVRLTARELQFDAAILLLIEEYDSPFEAHSNLLLRAASSTTSDIALWRFQGSQIPNCATLFKREVHIIWSTYAKELPGEMQVWLQEQHITATLFVPLLYQGKSLGSLGFSSRTVQQFAERARHRAEAFAEQAATAIEHAHLYETAREHEIFSQAMANVAARLNNFVTQAGDIQQMICREGAMALQADCALLYATDEHRQLVPIAAYLDDQETPSKASDWPYIRQHDFEIQSLTSLQPTLVTFDPSTLSSGALPAVTAKIPALRDGSSQPTSTGPLPAYGTVGGLRERRTSSLRGALMRRHVHTAILAPLIARDDPVALLILARARPPGTHKKRAFTPIDLRKAQDFTEQAAIAFTNAHLYQQLRTAHQRLQELDQLKDQFMVTASHELRTPLTAVQGYLELLAEYDTLLPPAQKEEFLQKARRGCDELVLLLSNVMDASRLEIEAGIRPAYFESVSVQEVIQHVIDLLEPQVVQEQRDVRLHIPTRLFVRADPARLRQVLLNISTNALKYSSPGTPLIFSARAISDHTGSAIISVTDRGKGIKPKDQTILFQRFVRLESDLNSTVRGSGLGLYISRRLIEAMEGTIWVESSGIPGTGSTFHIQLPLARTS